MDRRVWGFALLTAVIVAAFVVPVAGGRRVLGLAERAPTPDPPQVGECLATVASQRSALDFIPPVLAAPTGPCGTNNYGEVVAVALDGRSFPSTVDSGMRRPEVLACDPLVRDYVGWPITRGSESGGGSSTFVDWRPMNTISSALLGPDLWQYLSGQEWLACVAYPEFAPFKGSIRGSMHDGRSAEAFGACGQSASVVDAQQPISCVEPHRTEVFGWAALGEPNVDLGASCVALVQRLTGMRDVTADGALTVAAMMQGNDGQKNGASFPLVKEQNRVICSSTVAGTDRLVGTLIGIGRRELPWE